MQSKTDILQGFLRVQMLFFVVEDHKFLFNQVVQILHHRIIRRFQLVKIRQIIDVKSSVQLHQHNFNGVDFDVGKVLVGAEKIL